MTDKEIIKALKCCSNAEPRENCPYQKQCDETDLAEIALDLINRQQAGIERLKAMNQSKLDTIHDLQVEIAKLKVFKSYFDELYGKGLDIANWHLNGALEPFDNFYESALQEMAGETE